MRQNYNKKRQLNKLKTSLLLLMMVGFATSGAYAQHDMTIPDGLKMNKTYVPDDFTGETGNIFVEVFVTGHSVATHVPTDIVLVLDVSGSMDQNMSSYNYTPRNSQGYSYNGYGNNTYYYLHTDGNYYPVQRNTGSSWSWDDWQFYTYYRLRFQVGNSWYYLSGTGVTTTTPNNVTSNTGTIWTGVLYSRQTVTQNKMQALKDAVNNFVNTIAQDATAYQVDHRISIVKYAIDEYYGSEASLIEGNHRGAVGSSGGSSTNNYNYTEVVVNRRDPRTDAAEIHNRVNALVASGATAADYGMKKAQYVLAQIPANEERSKVVVMFTDGEPTYLNGFQEAVANATIENAYTLKHNGTINGSTVNFDAQVFTIGVFDNPGANTLNYMAYTSSNYLNAHSMTNAGTATPNVNYAYTAESSEGLNDIFTTIAGASGAMSLPAATIVQDMVSPNFHLPSNASGTVTAYAPKCLSYNETTDEYTFEGLSDAGFLTIGSIPDPQHPGQTINGVVTGGAENRLPNNFVTIVDNKVQMSGFNFSENWCGYTTTGGTNVIHGRKVVLKIPIVASNGMWGDGMFTNDPDESFIQIGDTYYGPFNNPTANVLGSVWTEVITKEPTNFDPMNIDSPEDLAWFISLVNGRIGYNDKNGYNSNNVASHPNLNGRLTADIDMSAHNWVPIGCGWQVEVDPSTGLTRYKEVNGEKVHMTYEGTFDGNGHVITGLKNNASKYYKQITQNVGGVVVFPGMFSDVSGTVKNLFVLDADFHGKHHNANFVHHGIIADTLEVGGTIFNCEAAGRITCNNDDKNNDSQLIYGGLVGLNNGGTIHSCMAMAELTAYTMGGMIGENRGSFSNGFTNGVYNYLDNGVTGKYAGGIAGINIGSINNCYVRFERDNTNLDKMGEGFNMICGTNTYEDPEDPESTLTGTTEGCYTPQIFTYSRPDYLSETEAINTNSTIPNTIQNPQGNPATSYTLTVSPTFYNMFTNDNKTGGEWGTLVNDGVTYNVYSGGTPLLNVLNSGKGNGASWKRTSAGAYSTGAGDINDDYPVLMFPEYTCLGSSDGIRIDYATSLNDMLHRHNNGNMNENTVMPVTSFAEGEIPWYVGNTSFNYDVTQSSAIYKGTINLYAPDDVTLEQAQPGGKEGETVADNSTADGVVVYIDENISLLQDASSSIEAYTGQTLQAFNNTGIQAGNRWHNVSSSLENSQFGWSYSNYAAHNFESDPCGWHLPTSNEDQAFFPVDIFSYHRAEFYCFFEPEYHWINFRRRGDSHWHMDNYEQRIAYYYNQPNADYTQFTEVEDNETRFIPGKGYLTCVDMSTWWTAYDRKAQFLQNRGTLNNGDVNIPVTYTAANEWTGLAGYNLLGNPYQSFLDFDKFVQGNSGDVENSIPSLWEGSKYAQTYAVFDPSDVTTTGAKGGKYLQYKSGSSDGSNTASQYINMHQGFFIQVGQNGTATFTNAMRTNDATPNFRGPRPAYPLINFTLTDEEGQTDVAVLELNRPENDGAKKMRLGDPTGRIYFNYDDEHLAIYFRNSDKDYQSLCFAAEEDGNFTLSWNTANANFSSLTLLDNITGVKTDMLTHDHYTFEGRVSDYDTRFKILFGAFTDVEENETTVSETFAFLNGDNLIVNGTGHLDVIDVLGRVIYATELTDTQNTVSLPANFKGVGVLRISNGNEVKVQKIIIK